MYIQPHTAHTQDPFFIKQYSKESFAILFLPSFRRDGKIPIPPKVNDSFPSTETARVVCAEKRQA